MTTHTLEKNPGSKHFFFPGLADSRLVQGVFSRIGGVSPKPWNSLNVGLHCGDDPQNVQQNRQRIKESLKLKKLISLKQVHGAKIHIITEEPAADLEIEGYDSLITDVVDTGLMIQQADCQAVLLFDPGRPAVGIAHVGWRGTVAGIIRKTIETMTAAFHTNPADLQAAISPGLGPCCAEFQNFRNELPQELHEYQKKPAHFDFWQISSEQLKRAGVRKNSILMANKCTVCDPTFFSYRREKICGRSASVIGLKQ